MISEYACESENRDAVKTAIISDFPIICSPPDDIFNVAFRSCYRI